MPFIYFIFAFYQTKLDVKSGSYPYQIIGDWLIKMIYYFSMFLVAS